MLDDDASTELIVLVSKPRRREVSERPREVRPGARARRCSSRCSVRASPTSRRPPRALPKRLGAHVATSRGRGSRRSRAGGRRGAARAVRRRHAVRRGDGHRRRAVRLGAPVRSNIPLRPDAGASARTCASDGHLMIDFGDDALTRGRAHPMIDQRTAPRPDRRRGGSGRTSHAASCSCSTSCSDTARTPTPRPSSAPALAAARGRRDDGRGWPSSSRCAGPTATRRTRDGRRRRSRRRRRRSSCPTRPPPGMPSPSSAGTR